MSSRPASFVLAAALFALVVAAAAVPATDGIATPIESDVCESFELDDIECEDFGGTDAASESSAASFTHGDPNGRVTWRADAPARARIDARAFAIPPPARG